MCYVDMVFFCMWFYVGNDVTIIIIQYIQLVNLKCFFYYFLFKNLVKIEKTLVLVDNYFKGTKNNKKKKRGIFG